MYTNTYLYIYLQRNCSTRLVDLGAFRQARPTLAASRDPDEPSSLGFGASSRPESFESLESLDRATPNDKSRPKRAPETLRDAIFDDFWSIFGSIFEVFRGCIARATRLAARRAEPLFLLTGTALSRVCRLCRKAKNRRKSTKNRSDNASRTRSAKKTRFFRSRTRLGVDFGSLGVLPGAPGRPFWRPGASLASLQTLPRRAGDAPGRSRGAPETPSGHSWTPRGVRRGSRERFSFDFGCPEVSPGIDFRSIFTMISDRFCERVGQQTAKLSTVRCSDRHTL